MSKDRDAQLADWLRYTEDPSYDRPPPTYATPKESQPSNLSTAGVAEAVEDDLL